MNCLNLVFTASIAPDVPDYVMYCPSQRQRKPPGFLPERECHVGQSRTVLDFLSWCNCHTAEMMVSVRFTALTEAVVGHCVSARSCAQGRHFSSVGAGPQMGVSTELLINDEAITARSQPQVSIQGMFKAPLLWSLVLGVSMMLSQQLSKISTRPNYLSCYRARWIILGERLVLTSLPMIEGVKCRVKAAAQKIRKNPKMTAAGSISAAVLSHKLAQALGSVLEKNEEDKFIDVFFPHHFDAW
uniref:Uncharacterized protein n=1 Tax=Globodera rostochiensis TaxID=31243 RepID=A0A914HK00_GLORO